MSLRQLTLVAISLGLIGTSEANTGDGTHCPPAKTANTDLNATLAGPGSPGIYNTSVISDKEYGKYNWCNMPHVRAKEYVVPSEDYELQYVEVIQRHHKRTPYASNTFFKEDISWDCFGEGPFAHAKASTFDATPIHWQAQRDTSNPFEQTVGPGFVGSTCVFPAITTQGLDDAMQHGEDLKIVYGDLLEFLPDGNDREKYSFRVTNNVITTQTLSGMIRGLFPEVKEHSAWIQSSAYDSLEPTYSCPAANALLASYQGSNPAWKEHLDLSRDLRKRFNTVSGIEANDTAGWNTSWDHPYDNLSAKQCHGKPLPCSINDTSICVTQEDANTIYRLGNYEYAYRYRLAAHSTLYSALKMGGWMKELIVHLQDNINGKSPVKYMHNFAHDGSMAPLLGLLQIDEPVWPGMGTEVVFELWKKDGENVVRVMFNGQPIKTSTYLGTLDMIALDSFEGYISSVIPADLVQACKV